MKIFKHNHTLYLGVSTGLFISALFLFVFSAFFSFTHETNQFAAILFVLSLLIYYFSAPEKQETQSAPKNSKIVKIIYRGIIVIVPLLCVIILIQGDIRSWLLIAISTILVWVIIK